MLRILVFIGVVRSNILIFLLGGKGFVTWFTGVDLVLSMSFYYKLIVDFPRKTNYSNLGLAHIVVLQTCPIGNTRSGLHLPRGICNGEQSS